MIASGQELDGIDLLVPPGSTTAVSGRVTGPRPNLTFAISLAPAEQPTLSVAVTTTKPDGNFRFERVPAGSYHLLASGPVLGRGGSSVMLGSDPVFGRVRIEVLGQSVDGIAVETAAGRSVAFALTAGESPNPPPGCPATAEIRLSPRENWGAALQRRADLHFGDASTIRGVAPGLHQLTPTLAGETCFAAAVPDLDFESSADSGLIPIQLIAAGSILGRLAGGDQLPQQVAIVLFGSESDAGTSRVAYPNEDGAFSFQPLRPGSYRLTVRAAAFPASGAWFSDTEGAIDIEVSSGAETTVELPARFSVGR